MKIKKNPLIFLSTDYTDSADENQHKNPLFFLSTDYTDSADENQKKIR